MAGREREGFGHGWKGREMLLVLQFLGGNKSKKIKESERCWLDDDISGPLPQTIITKIALG